MTTTTATGDVAVGEVHLDRVAKTFRAYHAGSLKETLIRVAKRQPLTVRRTILEGVDLRIARGERVAIIGKNGAGKSTLFRLMSGILHADGGSIAMGGRVSPLIEVTAGLVLDLTGAENIRLNGVLLGLTRREVEARFRDIVDFAELSEFIDTPVRYYSSGMQARLGFSVAVHVDADILLVDEVLAVGDIEFQRRCLTRLEEMSARGTTIVLVSHDHETIARLFPRTVWIGEHRVLADGKTADVLAAYRAAEEVAA